MKIKLSFIIFLAISVAVMLVGTAESQQKLAQSGFQFLSVGTSARTTAMGEAFTTVEGSSVCSFYNPAGLAGVNTLFDATVSKMEWIADITYHAASLAVNYKGGRYGVFGISLLKVDYGEFLWTRVAGTDKGYEDIEGLPEPNSYMIGLGYAKQLSDKFSVGGQVKYVVHDLGEGYVPVYSERDTSIVKEDYGLGVLAFDFGTLYKTGFKSLALGMTVRNFSQEIKYEKESFQLPLTFKIGVSMDVLDFLPEQSQLHSLLISIDAVHPRSFAEYLNIGGEYIFMNTLALRAGYITQQDDYGFTAGFGVKKFGIGINYSYTPFNLFETVNRFSVEFSL